MLEVRSDDIICPRCNTLLTKEIKMDHFFISECDRCIDADKCYKCKCAILDDRHLSEQRLCHSCINNEKFKETWSKSTPQQKLEMYGIIKLKKLAKNKQIKGYYKFTKQQLINTLNDIVSEEDFPIK